MTFSKMMVKGSLGFLAAGLLTVGASNTEAHVSIQGGPFPADSNGLVTFSVGHGCEGADTLSIEVDLPEEITSVRAMPSPEFGQGTVVIDEATTAAIAVIWDKTEVLATDVGYYQLSLRFRSPAAPFTTLLFPVTQICQAADGTQYTTEWSAIPGTILEDGTEPPPAAEYVIVPKAYPGWNKWTVETEVTDLPTYFGGAEIVWADEAAWSANPTTAELIAAEGITLLETIPAGTEVWAKY